jgi:hypothetical protein
MSVDNLLRKLRGRTASGRLGPEEYDAVVKLARRLVKSLDDYRETRPEVTDNVVTEAIRMVAKCIAENAGKID